MPLLKFTDGTKRDVPAGNYILSQGGNFYHVWNQDLYSENFNTSRDFDTVVVDKVMVDVTKEIKPAITIDSFKVDEWVAVIAKAPTYLGWKILVVARSRVDDHLVARDVADSIDISDVLSIVGPVDYLNK